MGSCSVALCVYYELCLANSMMSDYQPSMGDKTYTFNDVQGVSVLCVYVCSVCVCVRACVRACMFVVCVCACVYVVCACVCM